MPGHPLLAGGVSGSAGHRVGERGRRWADRAGGTRAAAAATATLASAGLRQAGTGRRSGLVVGGSVQVAAQPGPGQAGRGQPPARRLPAAARGPGDARGRRLTAGDWLVSRASPAASTIRVYTAHARLCLARTWGRC
jgi:hypothetical protein